MTVVLKLDTKPTLFEPIEVLIDGTKLRVKEITLGSLEKIQDLQLEMAAGSAKAIRQTLETLVEGKTEILNKLPVSKLRELVSVLVEKALKPELEEKNESRPGEES